MLFIYFAFIISQSPIYNHKKGKARTCPPLFQFYWVTIIYLFYNNNFISIRVRCHHSMERYTVIADIYYLASFISQWGIHRQKNPALSSGVRSVMRTTTEGGFYLRFRFFENFSVLASLPETEKVDLATDCHSLRCWLNLRNFSTESTVRELPS